MRRGNAASRPRSQVASVRLAIGIRALALRGGMMATYFIDLTDAFVALLVLKADLRGRALAGLGFLRPAFVPVGVCGNTPGGRMFLRHHD
jgi:hypothetical protein